VFGVWGVGGSGGSNSGFERFVLSKGRVVVFHGRLEGADHHGEAGSGEGDCRRTVQPGSENGVGGSEGERWARRECNRNHEPAPPPEHSVPPCQLLPANSSPASLKQNTRASGGCTRLCSLQPPFFSNRLSLREASYFSRTGKIREHRCRSQVMGSGAHNLTSWVRL